MARLGAVLLSVLILIVTLLSSPFFLIGVAWGCIGTAFKAGQFLITNAIVNKGRHRPSFDASEFIAKRRDKK